MIFVTVGTHEQQFDRLISCIDKLKGAGKIPDNVFMQVGYCSYIPKFCEWSHFLSYEEMIHKITEARIIITHGGPASFVAPLQKGKVPIVVPRQKKYNEHVNDHQLEFVRIVANRMNNILVVEETYDLAEILQNYNKLVTQIKQESFYHNEIFNTEFETMINKLFEGKKRR